MSFQLKKTFLCTTLLFSLMIPNAWANNMPILDSVKIEQVIQKAKIPMDKLIQSPYDGLYQIIYQDQTAYVEQTGQYLLIGDIYQLDDIKKNNQGQLPPFEKMTSLGTSYLNYAKLGTDLIIIDQKQTFVFAGQIVDLKDNSDITDLLQIEINKIDWNSLPLNNAIKHVKGNGQQKIAIFSDPHCPYCKQLEKNLESIDNVTIYTYLYPIKTTAVKVSEQIWCAKNPAQAWQDMMLKNRPPVANLKCKTPLQENLILGEKIGAYGTPTIVFENGYVLMGALPTESIEQILQQIKP